MSRHGDVKIITGSLYLQGGPKGSDSSHTATGNITASGNMTIGGTVGIGIESPTKKFEVNMAGTSADDGVLISNTNNDARLYLTNNETSWLIQNDYSNSGNLSFHNGAASPNQHAMVIEKTGNVGIGTTTPAEMLTVEGNISASGGISASGDIYAGVDNTKGLVLTDSNGQSYRFTVNTSGHLQLTGSAI